MPEVTRLANEMYMRRLYNRLMPGWWNGRHGGLKIRCRKACGFDSHPRHHLISSGQSLAGMFTFLTESS